MSTLVRSKSAQRGFTLVELLVAVAVGGFAIAAAAAVAKVTVQQSGRGSQATSMIGRSRIIARQMRADLAAVGTGSTGLVGVDSLRPPWNLMSRPSATGGFGSIPAVLGSDGIGAVALAGGTTLAGSDAIQLIVPDPSTALSVTLPSTGQTSVLTLGAGPIAFGCPAVGAGATALLYVADASAANGGGRTQLMTVNMPGGPLPIVGGNTIINLANGERLQFELAPGATIMCARITTYFVLEDPRYPGVGGWLMRSDIWPGVAVAPVGNVFVNPNPAAILPVSPGTVDMQFNYRVSSELAGVSRTGNPARDMWAFEDPVDPIIGGVGGAEAALIGNGPAWAEVRQVTASFQLRTLRSVTNQGTPRLVDTIGNRAPPIQLPSGFQVQRVTTSQILMSMRLFDLGLPSGVEAEPW